MIELNLELARKFLKNYGLDDFKIEKIAGDASFRSYYRIKSANKSFVMMFAPVDYENTAPFIKIDEILISNDLSAPIILAKDIDNGFLLLEDFFDATYSRYLIDHPQQEFELYQKAIDTLLKIHSINPKNLDVGKYNNAVLYREVELFIDWYLPYKNRQISMNETRLYKNYWIDLFDNLTKSNQVLVLRDYHADNLMYLPNRPNQKSVGLLDFQDALIGSYAYDLQSLLEDARRDINQSNREKLFDYFISNANYDAQEFTKDFEIISFQRNIKILGIFARLSLRDNKQQYLKHLPRVESFVLNRIKSTNLIQNSFKEILLSFLK